MLTDLLNQPCTLIQRTSTGTKTRYGAKTRSEATTETVCALQQQQRSDEGDELSSSKFLLCLRPDEDVSNIDGAVVAGLRYEFSGQPWPAVDESTGIVHHIEATVTRVAGAEAGS